MDDRIFLFFKNLNVIDLNRNFAEFVKKLLQKFVKYAMISVCLINSDFYPSFVLCRDYQLVKLVHFNLKGVV